MLLAVWIMSAFFLLMAAVISIKPDWIAGFAGRGDEIKANPRARRQVSYLSLVLALLSLTLLLAFYACSASCAAYKDLLAFTIPLIFVPILIWQAARLQKILEEL